MRCECKAAGEEENYNNDYVLYISRCLIPLFFLFFVVLFSPAGVMWLWILLNVLESWAKRRRGSSPISPRPNDSSGQSQPASQANVTLVLCVGLLVCVCMCIALNFDFCLFLVLPGPFKIKGFFFFFTLMPSASHVTTWSFQQIPASAISF